MTECADIGLVCNALGPKKALICKAFRVLVNRGADTFPIQHPGRPSDGPQRRGGDTHIADYMTKDTKLPPYLPYPRFLLEADMAQAAKLVYMVLLDRATLSQANGWTDEDGKLYLVFPIEGIANAIDRSPMTVKNALAELETAGLIERQRRGFSTPNHIHVKIPDGQDIVRLTDRKLSPNHLSNNNLSINHL